MKSRSKMVCKVCAHKGKDYLEDIRKTVNYRENMSMVKKDSKPWNKGLISVTKEERRVAQRNRYKSDVNYKLRIRLRNRLNKAVNYSYKSGSSVRDLGCTVEELKKYLELQFQPGMTWDNWTNDGWHIDHIIPLASFDLTDPRQLKKACHYSNLRPMWAEDNLSKGSLISRKNVEKTID